MVSTRRSIGNTYDDDSGQHLARFPHLLRHLASFHELTDEAHPREYLACGESFDKAGAYAELQGEALSSSSIDGYKSTVIGLPVRRLVKEFPT